MKFVFCLLFLSLLLLPAGLFAQKNSNNLISLPVSVSDRDGRYISGLKKEDFTIYQDGVEQKVAFFATYDEPLNIVLLLDTSGSTEGEALEKIKDAAKDFVELLKPNDKCSIATFDSQVNVFNAFTNQEGFLKKTIEGVKTAEKDGSVLFSAVKQISQNSFNNVEGRKVIVLLSDGKDMGSEIKFRELMGLLEETDVLIYSIFYQTGAGAPKLTVDSSGIVKEKDKKKKEKKPKKPKKPRGYSVGIPPQEDLIVNEEIVQGQKLSDIGGIFSLQEMSEMTAGRFYQSDSPNLRRIFKQVAGELREQYRLGYYPKVGAKSMESSDIMVKVERPDAVVRTRGKFRGK
jgi:VWFA-related protein